MQGYQVLIKRVNDNPLTGKAQYRVKSCQPLEGDLTEQAKRVIPLTTPGMCIIYTEKASRKGDFISPRKALGILPKVINRPTIPRDAAGDLAIVNETLDDLPLQTVMDETVYVLGSDPLMTEIVEEDGQADGTSNYIV